MRWKFFSFVSFSSLRSPLMLSRPSSMLIVTSFLLTPGRSTLTTNSLSVSARSMRGAQTADSRSPLPSVSPKKSPISRSSSWRKLVIGELKGRWRVSCAMG